VFDNLLSLDGGFFLDDDVFVGITVNTGRAVEQRKPDSSNWKVASFSFTSNSVGRN
jgi:hypothetical protein